MTSSDVPIPPDESAFARDETISSAVSGDIATGFIPETAVKAIIRIIFAIIEAATEIRTKSTPFSTLRATYPNTAPRTPNSRAYMKAGRYPNIIKADAEPNITPRSDSRKPCLIPRTMNGRGAITIRNGAANATYMPPENITRLNSIQDSHSNIILNLTFRPP